MRILLNCFLRIFGFIIITVAGMYVAVAVGAYFAGAHINSTNSLPKGLYWTEPKPAEKGDLVVFTPPDTPIFREAVDRGYIHKSSLHFGPVDLIKRIVAVEGDRVTVTMDGITVNGTPLKNARLNTQDGRGRPLTPCLMDEYQLAADEVFLYSDYSPNSFDSRYFGVQKWKHVKDVVRPVLIYVPVDGGFHNGK